MTDRPKATVTFGGSLNDAIKIDFEPLLPLSLEYYLCERVEELFIKRFGRAKADDKTKNKIEEYLASLIHFAIQQDILYRDPITDKWEWNPLGNNRLISGMDVIGNVMR